MVRTQCVYWANTDVTVYPVQGFTAYVIISIIWLFLGGFMVGIYPLWEARKGIWGVSLCLFHGKIPS
jgi:hypothetical protein